jgi:hypothetical protein
VTCLVHRTVNSNMSDAPTTSCNREGHCQSDPLLFTPDSPVHPQPGKAGSFQMKFQRLLGPLGLRKGPPRRLKQVHKCSQQVHTLFGSILSLPLLCISLVCVEAKI